VVTKNSSYPSQLWDWGNWANNIALRQIAMFQGKQDELLKHEIGSVLNFINEQHEDGSIEIAVFSSIDYDFCTVIPHKNVHKPVLAQHVAFILKYNKDTEWVKKIYPNLKRFVTYYEENAKHESGLFYFFDDFAIGVDNEPCTFYRPKRSTASIYLNCLMYKELLATAELANMLGLDDKKAKYIERAEALKAAIQENCWDERDGFFYSVDINLVPIDLTQHLHSGCPRHWSCLIMRIGVWTGFMAMWAGIATPEQAERMVREHYLNEKTFCSPYGVRSLSKMEKMYKIAVSGNPSCWLGPIWGIANYMVFEGLYKYGFNDEARDLAERTVALFGGDIEKNGAMHEYYDPESGEGVHNLGFQSWNLLSLNMMTWLNSGNFSDEESESL
jgi:putative isomerase